MIAISRALFFASIAEVASKNVSISRR